ncbi:MAG TPA: MmcB family DNA repair protein [Acetobacteraceae bacterium]|nr:MmcB family DNA repair protein [Acetobacteraceae bacterium]
MELMPTAADRAATIRRSAARLCARLGWAPLHEVPLPNGRRADILGLRPDGGFACIEVKSCVRDFQTDAKWPEYRAFCDRLYFAVDADFPASLLPEAVGVIVAAGLEADLVREAPEHPLAPARRRSLLHRFATLAALRLAARDDPGWDAALRTALRAE